MPRTLDELIFIRKCIQEDLKHKGICSRLDPFSHLISSKTFEGDEDKYQEFLKRDAHKRAQRKCWHLCYFTDAGDNQHAGVKDVAYRLNKAILKGFDLQSEGLTCQEFSALSEKEIEFLKTHYKNGLEDIEKRREGEKVEIISSGNTPGPTTNFGFESTCGSIKPMAFAMKLMLKLLETLLLLTVVRLPNILSSYIEEQTF